MYEIVCIIVGGLITGLASGLLGIGGGVLIHLDGMVDDKVHRDPGIDGLGISAQSGYGIPHGRQVRQGRDPGKILHEHPGG